MTLEQTKGWGWTPVLHPDDLEKCAKIWSNSVQTGAPYEIEYRFKRASDGTYRWHLGRALPVRDASGNIIKWFGTCTDIEDQKRAELERASLIVNAQVAEEASKLKSEFLANMSHEIRTPMNSIIGMAEILLETSLSEDQRKYVQIFNRAGNTLLGLINNILDLSKIEAGSLELENADFDLNEVISSLADILSLRARQKGINLVIQIRPGVASHYIGDANRLRQILVNLVSNSIKFTSVGEVVLKVEAIHKSSQPGILSFSITDTGIGMSTDQIARLFRPFTQGDSSITKNYGGTGLGLTISKQLVEKMGGHIGVESKLGVGSRFNFEIPIRASSQNSKSVNVDLSHSRTLVLDAEKPVPKNALLSTINQELALTNPASTPQTKLSKAAATEVDKRPLRILLVDDNEDNRLLILVYLKNSPYKVDLSEDGLAAFEKFKSEKYDLVLMDMQMPVMDGRTATRTIRKWEKENQQRPTPIIALTANALKEEMHQSIEAGCQAHVTKPVKKDELLKIILDVTTSKPHK